MELEPKRKMAKTEKEMELKRATVDIELKMKAEMNKNIPNSKNNLVAQLLATPAQLTMMDLQKFDGNI